ncbi:MAG: type II toxin-antitoxin system prevent-host-death family antitoxin, partial [Armatimonadota bacterium]|nr:type II toxin-antitoxin system prevent-host-death family antitoxin [Armatimonadota bacterium]
SVSITELKAHLAEYLRRVQGGEGFHVTVRGREVADLVPADPVRAALWRMVFNYLTKEEGLHHLVWVYSAGLRAAGRGKEVASVDYRRRFYPGDAYVDIAGIDIYPNAYYGWGDFREDTYPKAWEIMREVAPNKMLALCECQGVPNPDRMDAAGPKWLYVLPWYVREKNWNPPDWVKKVYPHELLVTLDELPNWKGKNP